MSAASAMLRGRVAAEALMVDTCTVTRLAGQPTDGAGHVIKTYTTVYTGKCKIQRQPRPANARTATIGEAEEFLTRLELHVPTTVTAIASDDIVTVTASAYDAALVGRLFHVRALAHKSLTTAHRFGLEEVTS